MIKVLCGAAVFSTLGLSACTEQPQQPVRPGAPASRGPTPSMPSGIAETVPPELQIALQLANLSHAKLVPVVRTGHGVIWGIPVDRKSAVRAWELHRKAHDTTGLYPLIVDDELVKRLLDVAPENPPAEILSHASSINGGEWLARRAKESLTEDEETIEPDFDADDPKLQEADRLASLESPLFRESQWFVVLVPTKRSWEVFAHLGYGAWNAYPEAAEHIAVMKYWNEKFGAEPVIVTGDCVEMRVTRPPTTTEECRALALEQFGYTAGDLINQGYGFFGTLARTLKARTHWFFWWD
jgi:hypothetical protein